MKGGHRHPDLSRRGSQAGFTLVDMLLALVIVGASLGAVYRVFQAGLAAWNRSTAEMELGFDGTYVIDLMAGDLRGAYLLAQVQLEEQSNGDIVSSFSGTPSTIEFLSSTPRPGQVSWPACFLRYAFEAEPAGGEGSLSVEVLPVAGAVALTEAGSEVVADNVRKVGFRYMREGAWKDEWNENALPRAVEITVEVVSADRRRERSFRAVVDIPAWRSGEISS